MIKSNIQHLTTFQGSKKIAEYLEISQTTVSLWRKRGYSSFEHIEQLAKYPNSGLTEIDFLIDFFNAIKRK